MYDAKKGRNTLQKVPGLSNQKPKQQQQLRIRVPAQVLTPTVSSAVTPTLPYQQKQNNGGGCLPEVRATNLTTTPTTSTTTATSRHHTHDNFVINKGIDQYSAAAAIPTSSATATPAGVGAEAQLLTPSIITPLPVVNSIFKIKSVHFNKYPRQRHSKTSTFLPSSSAAAAATATAGGAASAAGTGKFNNRRHLGGGLNNPSSKAFTPTQRSSSAVGTEGSAGTNPAECELAHAQVAGGCSQIKKNQLQQQQYNETIKDRIVDIDGDDDSKNNNNGTYNYNCNNSASALSGSGGEATAETFNVMRGVTTDGSQQQTTVGTTIAATAPATGNNLASKNNEINLLEKPTPTTPAAAAATGSTGSSTKGGVGYLRLQHVQITRVFYPSSSNKTGSASSRHLQNTSHRSFSSISPSTSGAVRTAAGGIPTAIGTLTGTDTDKYFSHNNTNNNIVGTNNNTTAATAPNLVETTSAITNNNNNNRNSSIGNNVSMGSNNNYMNYRHLYGSNNNDQNKQHEEQVPQQKQQECEHDRDQHDDIKFIDSDEITPTSTVSPDNTVGSVNTQIPKLSLNDKPPIYFKPITPPFQHRTLSHSERGTQRARPKSTIILPTTSRTSSATAYGGDGASSSYTFERVNNYKYTNGTFYVDSKVGGGGSSKNISGSDVVTIPQQQQLDQVAKAAAVAVLNAPSTTTTTAADNIDTLGIKNSIEKFNSLSDQKNQRSSPVSNNATISTNNINTATAAFAANNVGSGSNAVENIITSGGGGSSTNLHQSTSISSRLGAGYSHSLTRGTHRNNSGGNSSHGNISGLGGFGAVAGASHNSRTLTNKNIVAGIHHSARPIVSTATTSSGLAITTSRPRLGFANNRNSNSNSNIYNNARPTIRALSSIENIASGSGRPTTMVTGTAATTTVTNSTFLTTNNKLTQEYHQQQHKQHQYNNDSDIISYNSSSNSNRIATVAGGGSQILIPTCCSSSSSNNISTNVGDASSCVVTSITSTTTPTPETSNANVAAVSSSSNNSTSSSGTAVVTSTQIAVVIANESVRNAAGTTRTILPPVSPTTTATQRYWERENSGSISGIRGSHTLPTSTVTSSKYSSISNDTNKLSNGRDAASEGLCGLRNIGNTCFMNSVIQCLSHTTELTRFLRAHQGSRSAATKDQQILYEFAKLIQEMWTADVHSVTPMELKRAFSTKHRMYSDFNQQDAQEFLRFFLDSLHTALNTGVKNEPLNIDDKLSDNKKADLTWEWYIRHENSLIRELFVGQLKSTLKCTTCGNTSVTFDPFWDLSVSLPSSSRCKLEACLDWFIREEVLDGDEMPTCSKCKTRRKCTISFTIQRFPKYLVIHLKRFSETRWSKLSNIVEFPTGDRELNMGPYAANQSSSVQYSLYAVSNHMGSTAGGHYVALCKHPISRKWHEFNDNIVSDPIIESHLVSSCAYILFYERT